MLELFLEAAKRTTDIKEWSIGNDQFDRMSFTLDAWEEYQTTFQVDIQYVVPNYGHQVPGSGLEVKNDDPFFEGVLDWSVDVKVTSASAFRVMAWPVLDGKALWSAEDWAEVDQLFTYTAGGASVPEEPEAGEAFSANDHITLGNRCNVLGINGRTYTGILVSSIGKFDVLKAQTNLRKVLR